MIGQSLLTATASSRTRFMDFVETTKPRIGVMVLLTTLVGASMATGAAGLKALDPLLVLLTLLGTGLAAGGGCALNQFLEHEADALMHRTRDRPIPSGRLSAEEVRLFGLSCSVLGVTVLALGVNGITAALAAISCLGYLLIYTPLKKLTTLNTAVGAIFGAIPPMMGWTAIRGSLDAGAWTLFAILFAWQFPHFLAIALMYRQDYEDGGFAMLPVHDQSRSGYGVKVVAYSLVLLAVSILPWWSGLAGSIYLTAALVAGGAFTLQALITGWTRSRPQAVRLMFASILYLPALLAILMIDKA